jgi:hypothetical protein
MILIEETITNQSGISRRLNCIDAHTRTAYKKTNRKDTNNMKEQEGKKEKEERKQEEHVT